MNVFRLLELASERLTTNDALYHEQADTVLGILRSAGVLPHKRSSLNGVCRQGFWDQWRPKLRESLAHLVG